MKRSDHTETDSRIDRARAFIAEHLDRALTLEELAGAAAMSRHHFHRRFTRLCGVSVGQYIRGERFKRACYQLAFHRDWPVTEIAFDACYATPEAFSKAFKKTLGVSPTGFRNSPDFSSWSRTPTEQRGHQSMTVEIVEFKKTAIAAKEHTGPLEHMHGTLRQFIEWRKASGPSPEVSRTFNIYYDDPALVHASRYRMDVAAELKSVLKPNEHGIVKKVIPDLLCAKLRNHGSWDGLGAAMRDLYARWLPASGYEVGAFPIFVERINLYPAVAEQDLITDIYLPLKSATAR